MSKLTPTVKWAQREDSVFLTVDTKDASDVELKMENKKITFSCKSESKEYAFELELANEINVDKSKHSVKRLVELFLVKKEEGTWGKLTVTKQRFVTIDWDKWADSDGEAEDFDTSGMTGGAAGGMGGMNGGMPGMGMPGMGGGMDLQAMMAQMGGMGGGTGGGMDFGGLGGGGDMDGLDLESLQKQAGADGLGGGDSDDEELADLDAEEITKAQVEA